MKKEVIITRFWKIYRYSTDGTEYRTFQTRRGEIFGI